MDKPLVEQVRSFNRTMTERVGVGNAITITLPTSVGEALHLQEDHELAIEIAGDCIVLAPTATGFRDVWTAYQKVDPRYHNANRKLAE